MLKALKIDSWAEKSQLESEIPVISDVGSRERCGTGESSVENGRRAAEAPHRDRLGI